MRDNTAPLPLVPLFDSAHLAHALFAQSPFSSVLYNEAGNVVALNDAFTRMWGVTIDTVPPGYSVLADPELERLGALPHIRRAFAGEVIVTPALRYDIAAVSATGEGRTIWTEGHFWPVRDAAGQVTHVLLQHLDLTQRIERENAAELDRARLQLVAQASELFDASLDPRESVRQVAQLMVPRFADWCSVDIVNEEGKHEQLAVAHADPDKLSWARALREKYPPDMDARNGLAAVIRTGKAEHYNGITDAMLEASAVDAGHLAILRELDLQSVIIVPLAARGRVLGAMTLVTTGESNRQFTRDDVRTAEDLASRAALALDNAMLFRSQAMTADRMTRLQRATAALARAVNPAEVADAVLNEGVDALEGDEGVLCLLTDPDTLEIVKQVGLPSNVEQSYHRFPVNAPLPVSEVVRTGLPVFLEDKPAVVARYPLLRDANARAISRAWAALPLRVGGEIVGGIAFGFNTRRVFDGEERAFFEALALQCGQALERARLIDAERIARVEAENANRAKMEFLATMSHELRTPLNAIGGYADLLDMNVHGTLTELQRKDVERLRRSQQSLVRLVEDLLGFARIEAGSVEMRMTDVRIADILANVEEMMAPQLRAQQLVFVVRNVAPDLVIQADREKVEQILLNLLSNACKFTEHGTITVRTSQENETVRIDVADTGIGIAAEQLEAVFEPFKQVHQGYTRRVSGIGLGLSISRDLARRMGGDLRATSAVGEGSTFSVILPLRQQADPDQPSNQLR